MPIDEILTLVAGVLSIVANAGRIGGLVAAAARRWRGRAGDDGQDQPPRRP
ncbi:hypothetical protein FB565_008597 [Actinoplanes lutulentus]|uniref:Uncharacterized protein n=1 Tax=Actinoplanes lutulentus TaxID=1287878 RepID=A0A327Z3E0_9ACTN|nr:hypothetical protein [Actinoplanes lutulentus]MBB2948811.1 hypothetical protein [Actinoplanes lutulentus]RAK29723.1 hypothetical protein B0I29_11749 [Actinoplanes lutulentus]